MCVFAYKDGYKSPKALIVPLNCYNSFIFSVNEWKIYQADRFSYSGPFPEQQGRWVLLMWVSSTKVDDNTTKEELDELENCNNGNKIVIQLSKMQIHALWK